MKPLRFKESNMVYAENQDEYLNLPAYRDDSDPQGKIICCWEATLRERVKFLIKGRLWLSVLTFGRSLQPLLPDVNTPFEEKA